MSADVPNPRRPWPRSLRVLVAPRQVFAEVLAAGSGYGALFGMLLVELVLSQPLVVAGQAMRLSFSPGAALSGLLTRYVNFALPTGFVIFVLGLVLYYRLRSTERRVELWTAASVLAYTWSPHVLLVALSVVLASLLGVDHEIMPHHRFVGSGLGPAGLAGKAVLELSPSVALGVVALRAVSRPAPAAAPPTKHLRTTAAAALLLLAGGLTVAGTRVWTDWRSVRPVMPGDALPAFAVPGIEGGGFHVGQIHHQVALIDFWATWCPPCVAAMPKLEALHRELGDRGFRLVSINGGDEPPERVRSFAAEHGLTFPVYIDTGELRRRFRIDSFPTALLVCRHGIVRRVYIGDTSLERVRAAIEELLVEPDVH